MGYTSTLENFINLHREQLVSSGVPEHFWETLHEKLKNVVFDAGNYFRLVRIEYDREYEEHDPVWALQSTSFIEKLDPKNIYIIDHAWTFRANEAQQQLLMYGSLRKRLCNIFGLDDHLPKEELTETIFNKTWKISNTYSVGSAENMEDRLPVWYIMDEIGSAILHNDEPNCRIVPFVYINERTAYSLLFLTKDVEEGQLIFRDCAEGIYKEMNRSAALLPWVRQSFEHISTTPPIPDKNYYLNGHIEETLPNLLNFKCQLVPKNLYKVYSEYGIIYEFLSHERFELVYNEDEADILWLTRHFKDFELLSETPSKFINQFPFEFVITVKDLFCITCRKSNSLNLTPTTYNLSSEISNFVSYFQQRESQGLDNFWIIKPYNLARGMDTHITNNLNYIMRLPETGPKIAQKYIIDPVLFYRPECNGSVKFDIRYVILLKSVRPLNAYVYKNFFLRFANKPFELNEFDIYDKHFTVMNYTENTQLKHMMCDEFKLKWIEQYTNYEWDHIEQLILNSIKEVFECATIDDTPCGIAKSPQSRALYAADIMLEWSQNKEIQPKILEINFTPDCKRACDYYPNFYNDIFELLFTETTSDIFFKL